MRKELLLLIPVFAVLFTWAYSGDSALRPVEPVTESFPVLVKVTPSTESQLGLLEEFSRYHVSEIPPSRVGRSYYFELPEDALNRLRELPVTYSVLPTAPADWNDEDYYSYQEVYDYLTLSALLYPDIVAVESLGVSTRDSVTIWGVKISDNPQVQEDEPDVLFDGVIHAREPVNVNILVAFMDSLFAGYGRDTVITNYIDETEIWIVPIKNPEGYLYVETGIPSPWWRKNKRDNNSNGIFDGTVYENCVDDYPSYPDGVDLNRNYPEGWSSAGMPDSCSIVYRGPAPHSENETLMEKALVEREHIVASICYHSYSEYVGYCGDDPAGEDLCADIADAILRENGFSTYSCELFYGAGQSYNWMYWEHGVEAYLIETATEFFPSGLERIAGIVHANLGGIFTVLDRVHGSSIRGHVVDSESGDPLEAAVYVAGETIINNPRSSEPVHGRFFRLLRPGTYSLSVMKDGYQDTTLTDVVVEEGVPTILEIPLRNLATGIGEDDTVGSPLARTFTLSQNYPNPFNPQTTIRYAVPDETGPVDVKVSIYDLRGRLVRILLHEKKDTGVHEIHWDGRTDSGEQARSGVYLYRIEAGEFRSARKMILAK